MKRGVGLLCMAGLIGCGSVPINENAEKSIRTKVYQGTTDFYDVEAREVFHRDVCRERTIIFRAKNMQRPNTSYIGYAFARDIDCNDSIDEFRFRGGASPGRMRQSILAQQMISAFYAIRRR